MKKIFLSFFATILIFWNFNQSFSENISKNQEFKQEFKKVFLFWRDSCQHCRDAKKYLLNLENKNKIKFIYLWIEKNKNKNFFYEFVEKVWVSKVLPLFFIWWNYFQGFQNNEISWKKIQEILEKKYKEISIKDFLKKDFLKNSKKNKTSEFCSLENWTCWIQEENIFNIPFFWEVNLKNFWLFSSSAILWFIDGFNPCAMWVLVMFLTILLQIWDRKKMIQFAWIFILAEAVMYFLILTLWIQTFDFIWFDKITSYFIWILAIWAWIYFLYDFFTNDWTCKVWSLEQKRKFSERIKFLSSKKMSISIFFWILAIAFSVNIIEFACSIWIPQAFTKILDLNVFGLFEKLYYIFIYILFYMLDDFIVFWIAIFAFDKLWIATKYAKFSHLIWWILMLLIWILFIFDKNLLIF
jgi:glutaredoxin